MNIDERLIPLFKKIDFASRYIKLCENHNDFNHRLTVYELEIIKEFYDKNELPVKFLKGEKFFKVEEIAGNFKLQFKTVPSNGFVQFLFNVKMGDENLKIAMGMWEVITRFLSNEVVKKPIFTSEKELEEILAEAVQLYKDFKFELSTIV